MIAGYFAYCAHRNKAAGEWLHKNYPPGSWGYKKGDVCLARSELYNEVSLIIKNARANAQLEVKDDSFS